MSNSKKRLFAACKATLILLYIPSIGSANDPADTCGRPTIRENTLSAEYQRGAMRMDAFAPYVQTDVKDLDDDGDLDLVITSADYPDYWGEPWDGLEYEGRIWINDGDLNFQEALGDRPGNVQPAAVLFADFDNNGLVYFFVADSGWDTEPLPGYENSLMLQFNDGWENARGRLPPDPTGFTHSAAIADVDNDGDIDIFVQNSSADDEQYWLINNGNAHFIRDISFMPQSFRAAGGIPTSKNGWERRNALSEDFDGDGYVDLFVGGVRSNGSDKRQLSTIYWGSANGFRDET